MLKTICYLVALLVVLTWILLPLLPRGSDTYIATSVGGLVIMLVSWVLAVLVWSKVPRSGGVHTAALVLLVVLGFLWSAFYLFASARLLGSAGSREVNVGG